MLLWLNKEDRIIDLGNSLIVKRDFVLLPIKIFFLRNLSPHTSFPSFQNGFF